MITRNKTTIILLSVLIAFTLIGTVIFGSGILNDQKNQETRYLHTSWIYNYSDIEEMTYSSDVIALVRVDSVSNEYINQGTPFTEYNVKVISPVLNAVKDESLVIRVTGGNDGNIKYELDDAPLLKIGEEMLIFCKKNVGTEYESYTILSGAQGRLYYSNQKLNSLCMIDDDILKANGSTNIKIKDADLFDTLNQIRTYLDKKD